VCEWRPKDLPHARRVVGGTQTRVTCGIGLARVVNDRQLFKTVENKSRERLCVRSEGSGALLYSQREKSVLWLAVGH